MKTETDPLMTVAIDCSVCLEEIPASEARVFEAQDYIQYFCGIDCYDKFQRKPGHVKTWIYTD